MRRNSQGKSLPESALKTPDINPERVIFGSSEADIRIGGADSEAIFGNAGDDVLAGDGYLLEWSDIGETAGDIVVSGAGSDEVFGDAVILVVDQGWNSAVVELGSDILIDLSPNGSADFNEVYGDGGSFLIEGDASGGPIQIDSGDDLIAVGNGAIYGDFGAVTIYPENSVADIRFGDDSLFIGDGSATGDAVELYVFMDYYSWGYIQVFAGNDTLVAGDGGATLYGDFQSVTGDEGSGDLFIRMGNDTLLSGAGNDIMFGDLSFLWMTGQGGPSYQTGADTFVFAGVSGDDEIFDFEIGRDQIIYRGLTSTDRDLVIEGYDAVEDEYYMDFSALGGGTLTLHYVEAIGESDVILIA